MTKNSGNAKLLWILYRGRHIKLIFSLLLTPCIIFFPYTQIACSQAARYDFKKIPTGTWRASNTKCLIEYNFKNNLMFTFFNTCADQEKTTGAAVIINKNRFLLKHDKNKNFKAVYNGRYLVVKYDKGREYIFLKLQ